MGGAVETGPVGLMTNDWSTSRVRRFGRSTFPEADIPRLQTDGEDDQPSAHHAEYARAGPPALSSRAGGLGMIWRANI